MKKIWLRKNGGPEVLQLEENTPLSEIGPRDVWIQVHYSGINFADIVMRLGLYPAAPPKPFVPGYEVSGIVEKVGSAVTRVKVGDQVLGGSLFGGYASQVCVSEDLVFPLPKGWTLAEGAAMPVNWITAHAAIMDMGRVRKGDKVLLDAATGGVGTIALQMLNRIGAETIGLTSSPAKCSYIESFGAKAMTHEEFKTKGQDLRFDFILNSQGGKTVRDHYNQLTSTGRVVALGISSAIQDGKRNYLTLLKTILSMPKFSLVSMFDKNRGVYALNALTLLQDEEYKKTLQGKWEIVSDFSMKPHVDKIFPAKEAGKAHRYLESKQARGKVVIGWV